MDDGGPTASYIIFLALLLIDMLFYGFGAAAKELNSKDLYEEAEEKKNKKARRLYEIAVDPERYINTVQLVITLINLVMGGFFLSVWRRHIQFLLDRELVGRFFQTQPDPALLSAASLILSGALLLYILLTFGVLIPKKLGVRYAWKWAFACINPIYYMTRIFTPITGLISVTSRGVLRVFGVRPDESEEDVTEEEIISMVNEGHEQGVLLATEAEMITNIFELGDKEARDIMTHRSNILAIDRTVSLSDAIDYMLSESKSRFPVYEENIDHIVGILHFRDAMRAYKISGNINLPVGEITGLLRDAMFVPETKNIDGLFRTMQQTKTQMVIIIDEYGQTSGLLAMEDILEEIVGNIMDEYDEDEAHIAETENDDEYIMDGLTRLEELTEKLGLSFGEQEFDTINGFMISKMDKIPEEDEQFSIDVGGYEFKILAVENRMIKSVLVSKLAQAEEKDADNQKSE
ncbi:MAG: HlyC/CorC family transporter [Lachnospiraceae bacterium]|nr:HlyC/CorC family transporter [Lachnospiraceae bacterium]